MNPKTTILTELYFAETLLGERTQVRNVQEIPPIIEAAEAITYDALDYEAERQEQAGSTSSAITIPILYQETEHDVLKSMSDSKETYHWFVKYPNETAVTPGKPLVKHFTGSMNLVGDTMSIRSMIMDTLTIYRNSDVTEYKGFPETPSA